MRTPSEYAKNLNNGIITESMLDDALWSVNKRAKNHRDNKRRYREMERDRRSYNRYYYDKYSNAEKAEQKEKQMYARKEQLLSLVEPDCIHQELGSFPRTRIYEYEDDYDTILFRELFLGTVVWFNSYWNYIMNCEVFFFDYEDLSKPAYRSYLFYQVGSHSYHSPISDNEVIKSNLPKIRIDSLKTEGHEIADLLSVQFVDKMIDLIKAGHYEYTGSTRTPALPHETNDDMHLIQQMKKERATSLISENWDFIRHHISVIVQKKVLESSVDPCFSIPVPAVYWIHLASQKKMWKKVVRIQHKKRHKKRGNKKNDSKDRSVINLRNSIHNAAYFPMKEPTLDINNAFRINALSFAGTLVTPHWLADQYIRLFPDDILKYQLQHFQYQQLRTYYFKFVVNWLESQIAFLR